MNDKAKDILVKASVAVTWGFFALIFVQIPFLPDGLSESESLNYFKIGCIRWLLSGVVMIVLISRFGIKPKSVKAEKLALTTNTYEKFIAWFVKKIAACGYEEQVSYIREKQLSRLFIKVGFEKIRCIYMLKEDELTEEKLDKFQELFWGFLEEYYGTGYITDMVYLITIICVDKVNPDFYKYTDENVSQQFKLFRLPIGICFKGNTVYIAKQKGGLFINRYRELRKEFLRMVSDIVRHNNRT